MNIKNLISYRSTRPQFAEFAPQFQVLSLVQNYATSP
jgi:hypothetical protein